MLLHFKRISKVGRGINNEFHFVFLCMYRKSMEAHQRMTHSYLRWGDGWPAHIPSALPSGSQAHAAGAVCWWHTACNASCLSLDSSTSCKVVVNQWKSKPHFLDSYWMFEPEETQCLYCCQLIQVALERNEILYQRVIKPINLFIC